jgi:glycine amidinotransferase
MNDARPVNSFDEWTRLKEVVVGRAEHYAVHHVDPSFRLLHSCFENVGPLVPADSGAEPLLRIPAQFVAELTEDIDGFVAALSACGVKVQRPAALSKSVDISSPFWRASATPALNIRDQTIILGDTIVETAPHVRARIFENDLLRPVFYRYFESGSNWVSMPRPALARGTMDDAYFRRQGIGISGVVEDDPALGIDGLGHEMIFDGAQCMRLGRDVLVNVANENHELALRWLTKNFPRLRFHRLDAIFSNHIDTVVVPLRPGLMLLRSPRYLGYLPEAMRSWQVIYPPDGDEARFPDYSSFGFNITSPYIDLNVLSIDEDTVVVNSLYPELISRLEGHGFTVVPVRHRHRRLFGGGFHCFTLDAVRAGGREDYLS